MLSFRHHLSNEKQMEHIIYEIRSLRIKEFTTFLDLKTATLDTYTISTTLLISYYIGVP